MKALYAGSFDPFTIGHYDITLRALRLFGKVIIGVGYNEKKTGEYPVGKRVEAIRRIFEGTEDVEVKAYSGLTVEFAKKEGVTVLIRGVRNSLDFEKEKELADINREIGEMETVFLSAKPELSFISSSMVRELIHNGYDVARYLPEE